MGEVVNLERRWTRRELRMELGRRALFPATTDELGYTIPQKVTAAELEAELSAMPADAKNRAWHEWELALARDHERLTPGVPFIRSVVVDQSPAHR